MGGDPDLSMNALHYRADFLHVAFGLVIASLPQSWICFSASRAP